MTEISHDGSRQIALITGASRGLGAAVAKILAAAGMHVVLMARTVGALEAIDDDIRAQGGSATLIPFDLLKLDDIAGLGPALFERFGRLDLLVANAAMLGHFGPVAHYDAKIWDRVMALNFTANHRLIQTLDRLLRAGPNGRAFFITDGAADAMAAYGGAYAVSKAALTRMVMQYAEETKQTTLRVNLIDPGAMRTSLRAQGFPGEDPALLRDPGSVAAAIAPFFTESGTHHGELLQPGTPPVHFADLELSRRVC